MDEEGIGLVLARVAELRLKINNCIHQANLSPGKQEKEEDLLAANGDNEKPFFKFDDNKEEEEEDYDEEAERLLTIHCALESLEPQLSNLQNLQLQQRYDRQIALAEIEFSRKLLLEKLKEYNGENLEVIHEASAFAGETLDHDNNLLLPPYPSRFPQSLNLDKGYLSQFHFSCKPPQNGVSTGEITNEARKNLNETTSRKGLGHFISSVAKTVLPLVGVIYVLSRSGFAQNLEKKSAPMNLLGIFRQPAIEEKRLAVHCPPGKVQVVKDREVRCLVKERVEIPFAVAAKPDINYGIG